jgi:gamma-glutamylaminecyclotransferase
MAASMDDDLPPLPPIPLGRYRHYKGGEYEVLGVARHSETHEPMVVYRPLYNATGWWVRPHAMFVEDVEVAGRRVPRFAAMDHLVFVFGTLKEGFPNFATNRGTRVGGTFTTCTPYPLYLVGERHVPWLVDRPGEGLAVDGEVYRVDDATLAAMDRLERVTEPDGYRRLPLQVQESGSGERRVVQAYLKPPAQLVAGEVRAGPLAAYTPEHAASYRRRP